MPDEDQKPNPREPPPLSAPYHRAHKQLILWSAILLFWELAGVETEKLSEVSGNPQIIKSFKSPQAIPWALLLIMTYFVFKLRLEWGQCSVGRRQIREAKADYHSALILAVIAFVVYLIQAGSRVQLANLMISPKAKDVEWGMLVGLAIIVGIFAVVMPEWTKPAPTGVRGVKFSRVFVSILATAATTVAIVQSWSKPFVLVGISISTGLGVVTKLVTWLAKKERISVLVERLRLRKK